eukprot:TRINITY_DN10735_c0_g1_i1.p1 TRINITY_DN10735_c0_g1~~TRINITY_DN10735_c0_g1_i1.p1  ORF type:complete len:285 (-),score=55.20 TRINITY_DN10735_c0_g1_i1:301-1155(-)
MSFILWAMYMKTTQLILEVFNCEEQTISRPDLQTTLTLRYLRAAPYITCGSSEHTMLLIIGSLALLVYVVGFPALVGFQMYRKHDLIQHCQREEHELTTVSLDENQSQEFVLMFRAAFSVFYSSVVADHYWYPFAVHTIRRVFLVAILALSRRHSVVPVLFITVVLFSSLVLHIRQQPYRVWYDNFFETATLSHALLSFQFRIVTSGSSQLFTESSGQVVLTVIDVLGYVLFVVILLCCAPRVIRLKVASYIESWGPRPQRRESIKASQVQLELTEIHDRSHNL